MEAVKRDFHRALRVYETNCLDHGHGHSCHKVGGYRSVGRACSKDMDEAYDFFAKGCQLGHFAACYNAGLMDSDKTGSLGVRVNQQPDPRQAVFFFKKACDQGEFPDACYQYSSLCIKGQEDILEVKHLFSLIFKLASIRTLFSLN